jgi:hypothetical protein
LICLIKNLFEYRNITSKIHDNLINYLIVTTIIMLASGLVIYLLLSDILKRKSQNQDITNDFMMIENNDKSNMKHIKLFEDFRNNNADGSQSHRMI